MTYVLFVNSIVIVVVHGVISGGRYTCSGTTTSCRPVPSAARCRYAGSSPLSLPLAYRSPLRRLYARHTSGRRLSSSPDFNLMSWIYTYSQYHIVHLREIKRSRWNLMRFTTSLSCKRWAISIPTNF